MLFVRDDESTRATPLMILIQYNSEQWTALLRCQKWKGRPEAEDGGWPAAIDANACPDTGYWLMFNEMLRAKMI